MGKRHPTLLIAGLAAPPRSLAALSCVACLAACSATVDYRPATLNEPARSTGADAPSAPQEAATDTGIRYYENSPYLLIYSNAKGGLKWQILYLPDQTKLMTATPKVVGGHTEMTMYFHNGVLAGASAVGDTTQLPKAVLATVQSAIPLLTQAHLDTSISQPNFPAPYLYKIVVQGDQINFYGGQGEPNIFVPIKKAAAQ